MTHHPSNTDIIREITELSGDIKSVKEVFTIWKDQNSKEHKNIIKYQKEQNGNVSGNSKRINKLEKGRIIWYFMTFFATTTVGLLSFIFSYLYMR